MKKGGQKVISFIVMMVVLVAGITFQSSQTFAASPISVYVDGQELYMDVPPVIMDGRTMVPLRAVSEAVGCKVDWFSSDQRIVVYSPAGGDPLVVMNINDRTATVNNYNGDTGEITGRNVTIEAPPVIVNGRTMVPLRFIAETIGFEVEWDSYSKTVFLISALYEGDYGDGLIDDVYDTNQSTFPQGVVYSEEYFVAGEPGDGLSAEDAAVKLVWDQLISVYDVYNAEDPVYITLIDLEFVNGEECYVFEVKKAQYTGTLYGVSHSGNIYENIFI